MQGNDCESVIEILAKRSIFDHRLQVSMRSCNHPNIDVSYFSRTDLRDFSLLKDAEQFHLRIERKFADLIEKESTFVSGFDFSRTCGIRACKRAALEAKQLCLDKVFRYSSTINRDKRFQLTATVVMNRASEQLFACACFTMNEHGRVMLGNARGLIKNTQEALGAADNPFESIPLVESCPQMADLFKKILLFILFKSVRFAALIITVLPLASIGGVFGLFLSGEYLSVPASVGFIALWGIAVLNGVVLVSYIRKLREEGLSQAEAIREGTRLRFRPVMMTAIVAALGLVPFLFATGPGSEIQRPLAIVVIGGLLSSTLLTLVLVPVVYGYFSGERHDKIAEPNLYGRDRS
jgi:hypothetical protein